MEEPTDEIACDNNKLLVKRLCKSQYAVIPTKTNLRGKVFCKTTSNGTASRSIIHFVTGIKGND